MGRRLGSVYDEHIWEESEAKAERYYELHKTSLAP